MPIDLEELERLASGATPGPWRVGHGSLHRGRMTWFDGWDRSVSTESGLPVVTETREYQDMDRSDAVFIASARDAVPALIAEVRRLRAEVERRPEITPEDALIASATDEIPIADAMDASARIRKAIRAHAAKVKP